jgi:hypothetical protein
LKKWFSATNTGSLPSPASTIASRRKLTKSGIRFRIAV